MMENNLTSLEKWNLTAPVTAKLDEMNQGKAGCLIARISGIIALPFISLVDAGAHASLAAGKLVTGIVISIPLTIVCQSARRDFQFSSALIHLSFAVESVFNAFILPFICLLDPHRAYQFMQPRLATHQMILQLSLEDLQEKVRNLTEENSKVNELKIKLAAAEQEKTDNFEENKQLAGAIVIHYEEKQKLSKEIEEIKRQLATELDATHFQKVIGDDTIVREKLGEEDPKIMKQQREIKALKAELQKLRESKSEDANFKSDQVSSEVLPPPAPPPMPNFPKDSASKLETSYEAGFEELEDKVMSSHLQSTKNFSELLNERVLKSTAKMLIEEHKKILKKSSNDKLEEELEKVKARLEELEEKDDNLLGHSVIHRFQPLSGQNRDQLGSNVKVDRVFIKDYYTFYKMQLEDKINNKENGPQDTINVLRRAFSEKFGTY